MQHSLSYIHSDIDTQPVVEMIRNTIVYATQPSSYIHSDIDTQPVVEMIRNTIVYATQPVVHTLDTQPVVEMIQLLIHNQ